MSGLGEQQVVEWALLGGNDFTAAFHAAAWGVELAGLLCESGAGDREGDRSFKARLELIRERLASGAWAPPGAAAAEEGGLALASRH